MPGLIISEVILFAAAGLMGFGLGSWLYVVIAAQRKETEAHEIEQLRAALTEVQVRRARVS